MRNGVIVTTATGDPRSPSKHFLYPAPDSSTQAEQSIAQQLRWSADQCERFLGQLTKLSIAFLDKCCRATEKFTFIDCLHLSLCLGNVNIWFSHFVKHLFCTVGNYAMEALFTT